MTRFAQSRTRYCGTSAFLEFACTSHSSSGSFRIGEPKRECALSPFTDRQLTVLHAAKTREAGGHWAIERIDGLDCIEAGWLTEDYYLTDAAKRILQNIDQ